MNNEELEDAWLYYLDGVYMSNTLCNTVNDIIQNGEKIL